MDDRPFNLTEFVLEQSPAADAKEALVLLRRERPRVSIRYGELRRLVRLRAGELLARGFLPGDRVLLRLDQSIEYAVWFLAVIRAGLVAVPLSVQLTAEEVEYAARDSDANLILCDRDLPFPATLPERCAVWEETTRASSSAQALPLPVTRSEDPAFIVYTSGTSGFPKGVVHAQRVVVGRTPMFQGWTGIKESDRILHAGQLNWTYAMGVGVLDPLRAGATGFISAGEASPEDWPRRCIEERLTIFAAVPGLYRKIVKYAPDGLRDVRMRGCLRHALVAGAPVPETLYSAWKEQAGSELYEALGMSEVSTYISSGPGIPVRPGSPGKAQEGRRVAILPVESGNEPLPVGQTGLLAVHRSDPGLMLGYLHPDRLDSAAFRGEWFTGGDLAHIDEDGYVHFHGRSDELLNAFGYRVSPVEVERVLARHPDVQDAAVGEIRAGGRDDVTIICAFVIPRNPAGPGGSVSLKDRLLRYVSEHLAAYKCPREIRVVGDLPRNRNGKLDRRKLPLL